MIWNYRNIWWSSHLINTRASLRTRGSSWDGNVLTQITRPLCNKTGQHETLKYITTELEVSGEQSLRSNCRVIHTGLGLMARWIFLTTWLFGGFPFVLLLVWQTSRAAYVATDAHVIATTTHATRMQPTHGARSCRSDRDMREQTVFVARGRLGKEPAGINNATVRGEAEASAGSAQTRLSESPPSVEADSVIMNQSDRLQCYMLKSGKQPWE